MSSGVPRAWSSRSARSRSARSSHQSGFSVVQSNFRLGQPNTPLIPEVRIQQKTRTREISINDAPMMLLPKARVRDSLDYYGNSRRSYTVMADNETQGLHISTIQSFNTMDPKILPRSVLKTRSNSVSRSEADSGIGSLKRSVTFENLCHSQSTVYRSDDESDNLSDVSTDDTLLNLDPDERVPENSLPDHLDAFGGDEPILLDPPCPHPRPPSRTASALSKRRKHCHSNDQDMDSCDLCGTILSDRERVQRSFGKVDTFLDWVMTKWGKEYYNKLRQELQFIPRPSYVYRGHTPHFCNFVQQIPLHKKNGSTTESIGMPDSELDEEMEFITESIEGRLINKWRKNSSSSPSGSITLTRMPKLDDYVKEEVVPETSGTEGRPGSPSSVDESEVKSDDGNQKRPVSSVEVKVSTPTKPDTSVKSHTLIRENEPKEDVTSYKSDGLSIPEVIDEGGVNDKMGGAWEDNKSNKGDESYRIPSGADDSGNESQRPPSPSRPPPSPEPVVVAPPPEPAPKTARRKSCAKKTKKPVERARKMKEPEVVKEPDPPAVEEVTTPDLPALDSDKAEVPKVELAVPDLPSTTDNKDKSKKEKTKPKRHLIEVEDDLFKQDPTDLLNDQMKYNRVEIDWSGMDMNGMDEVKKAAPIKSWITGRLALSQQASRFELPMDMKLLETMTPQEYVKKHCIISSRRQNLYQKIFMKNKDKTHLILFKDLDRTLKDVLVNTITSDQVKEVLNLLEIDENTRIDNKLFAGLAAFAERVLYPKYVTEDTQDMPEYQKERIECADFCALDWKFHGVNVSPQMSKLLKMIN